MTAGRRAPVGRKSRAKPAELSPAREQARALLKRWQDERDAVGALPAGAIVTRAEWLAQRAPIDAWLADQNDPARLRAGWAILPVAVLEELLELASTGLADAQARAAPRSGRPHDSAVATIILRAWLAGQLADVVELDDVLALPELPPYYARDRGLSEQLPGAHLARRERLRGILRLTPVRLRVGRPRKKGAKGLRV